MTVKTLLTFGALASLAMASAASAQTPAAAAPASGPPIPGVCVFFRDEALATSTAGKGVTTRMNELKAQVNAELTPEAQSIREAEQSFQALPQAQKAVQGPALQQRIEAFQQKAQRMNSELEGTLQKEYGLITADMAPIVEAAYASHKCSILLERGQVYFANPEMDITSSVIQSLNAKLPSVPPFNRENLNQQATAAAPAPASTSHTTHHRR